MHGTDVRFCPCVFILTTFWVNQLQIQYTLFNFQEHILTVIYFINLLGQDLDAIYTLLQLYDVERRELLCILCTKKYVSGFLQVQVLKLFSKIFLSILQQLCIVSLLFPYVDFLFSQKYIPQGSQYSCNRWCTGYAGLLTII